MHRAEEDYLKCIYKIIVEEKKEIVKANEISDALGYTIQTVNEMVKRLDDKGFLFYEPYKGVTLTEKGVKDAKRLVRNHRLWEVFLVKKLDYSWTEVHEEAEKLEHASSDKLIGRINKFLGEPKYCVHGNEIPQLDDREVEVCDTPLSSFKVSDKIVVKRVVDQLKLLQYLDDQNISLDTSIKILEIDKFNEIIKIEVDNQTKVLSLTVAKKVFGVKET